MASFILLGAKGAIKCGSLDDMSEGIESALGKSLKRAKSPSLIGSWVWQKYKLFLYGYKEGRAGTENKHELPPPHDEAMLFGDACVVASLEKSAEKPAAFSADQYKKFYNTKFGGFEEIAEKGDDDDEAEEEEEEEEEDLEEDYEEEEIDDEEDGDILEEEEEEEQEKPTLRIKASAGFKKIAKWMHSPELTQEDYVL